MLQSELLATYGKKESKYAKLSLTLKHKAQNEAGLEFNENRRNTYFKCCVVRTLQ